jgi:P4 family phage/plasmid primase-like protien
LGFDNGIYDLKLGKLRDGEPDDLVSKTVGFDYEEFDVNHETVKEIELFYSKIQPDPDVNLLLKCYTASMFEGGNKDQKMVLLIGVGSNGKGTYIDLTNGTFGDRSTGGYYDTISPTVFTQKRTGSSNATPELADKFDIRSLGFQEIDADDQFHLGLMKSMTGQDKIPARPLYGQPFTYIPLFKLFAAMNTEPVINSDDNGTWRRILKIDFPTVFTSNPKKPNERKGDPDVREKLVKWYPAHAWLLLNVYYPIYKKNGGLEKLIPDSVRMSTNKYKSDSNVFIEFLTDNITHDDNSKLEKTVAWTIFKDWYLQCYNTKNTASHKKLMQFFEKNGYKIDKGVNGAIHGIKIREECVDEI